MTTPEKLRRRQHIIEVMVGITLIIVGLGTFWQDRDRAKQDEKIEALVNTNTKLTECLAVVTQDSAESTKARSDAAEAQLEAEMSKEMAMSIIMGGRVQQQQNTSEEIQQAALQWQAQFRKWYAESKNLQEVRTENPFPEYEEYCPKVEMKKAKPSEK